MMQTELLLEPTATDIAREAYEASQWGVIPDVVITRALRAIAPGVRYPDPRWIEAYAMVTNEWVRMVREGVL